MALVPVGIVHPIGVRFNQYEGFNLRSNVGSPVYWSPVGSSNLLHIIVIVVPLSVSLPTSRRGKTFSWGVPMVPNDTGGYIESVQESRYWSPSGSAECQ